MWLYYYIKSWFVNFVNDHAVSQWFRRHISSGSCCSFGLTCMLAWVFRGNAQHCLRKTSFYDRNMFERTDPWEALIVSLDSTTNKHICSFTFDYYYYFFHFTNVSKWRRTLSLFSLLRGQVSDPVYDPERLLVLDRKWIVAGAVVENGPAGAVDRKPNSYNIEHPKCSRQCSTLNMELSSLIKKTGKLTQ